MTCVVCRGTIGEPHYANAWEKVRKLSPCCSEACAASFDPDVHWLPATAPALVTGTEEARLAKVARDRLTAGDNPSVVVREMLNAGMAVLAVRKLVRDASLQTMEIEKDVKRLNLVALIGGLFGARGTRYQRVKGADPAKLHAAEADLDAWIARFR
jgi:hypothetical protein